MANVSLPSIFQDASAVASEEASRNAGLPGPSGGGARGPRHPKYNPRLAVIAQLALAKKKGRQIDLVADTDSVNVLKDKALYRAEREINLSHFRELMQIFERASKDGKKQLDMENFKRAFGAVLGKGLTEEQMGLLFMQVDANTDNAVDWEEFSTFMLLRAERQTKMREEASIQLFDVPSTMLSFPKLQTRHHEAIIAVIFVPGQNRFITCSREGTLCVWTESLKLQRCFTSICSRRRHLRDTIEDLKPQKEKKVNILRSPTPWAHDCVLMANLNKFAVASDDHEITFYEYSTLSPHIRLDLYDSVALSLHYWVNSENPDNDVASLFFSTDQGYVCEFTFSIAAVIAQKKRKGEAITISLVSPSSYHPASLSTAPLGALGGTLTRHKVHEDWAVKVRYYHELHSLVSCSPDPKASLVVAQRIATKPGGGGGRWSIFTAPVCKGVNTFAYSHFPVSLVTGGADRQLRVWNPHRLSHPMAALKGHNAPIIDISINDIDGQVISLSSDNMIKVWDLRTMQCLQSLLDRMPLESDVPLSRIFFNSSGKGKLLAVSNGIAEFKFKGKSDTQVTTSRTHEYPLRAALYNPNFRQIVTGCDGGVIQVWDALTGLKTFRFSEAHGKAEITAMGFDTGHRRLVTGARDGTIFVWNFHNGQLIRELVKPDSSEVTSIMYIEMNETQFIVATSWNKTVVIFEDDASAARIRPRAVYPNKKDPTPWHHEDVLCCDFCPPFLLATGSYDGQIAISNLQSGHLIHRLKWPGADDKSNPNRSIDKVLFLKERIMMKNAATLLTTGADGVIRWWQIDTAFLIWEMDATQGNGEGIYAMSVNSSNNLLVTGDSQGWVTVFDISLTCIDDRDEITPPNVLSVFRGHLKGIVSIDLMESSFMVTASTDGTARVFTVYGVYVGTLGQDSLWDLSVASTYSKAGKPSDVSRHEAAEHVAGKFKQVTNKVIDSLRSSANERRRSSVSIKEDILDLSDRMQRRTSIELDDNTSEGDGDPELTNSAEGPDPVITQRRKSQALAKDVALHPTSQRPPKTADLLQASYQTWYARSEFARSIVTDMKKRQQRYAAPSASCLGVTLPPLANDSNRGGGKPSATESLLLPSAVAANASSPPAVSPAVSNTVAAVANPLAGCRSTLPRLPLMELSSARGARAVQSMTVSELLNADLGVVLTEGASGGPEGSRNP